MKIRLLLGNLLSLSLCIGFFALNARAENFVVTPYEGLKIARFQESGEFVWCGTKHLAISRHSKGSDAGIRLLNIEDGRIRQLTTIKTHRVIACTPDGKHIYFVENGVQGVMSELDVGNGQQQIVYSKNTFQHEVLEEAPISPSGEILIGPATLSKRVILSDRTVSAMHVPNDYSEKFIKGIAWSGDGAVFIIFGSDFGNNKNNPQQLLIQRNGDIHPRVIDLPSIKNAQFMQAGWSDVSKRLYLLSWRDTAKLYEIDPEEVKHSLHLIATDVDEFRLMPNGNIVYVQNFGVNYSKSDSATIKSNAHRSLLLRTTSGKYIEMLRVPYSTLGISGIQISPNGKAVATRVTNNDGQNESMEILVFFL